MNITPEDARVLIYALDVLTNLEGDRIERDELYRTLYRIAKVEK